MNTEEVSSSIIFEDDFFLIANKPSGIAAQEDKSEDHSFFHLLTEYCDGNLFLVHRLDRPTSGIMIFAKNKKSAAYYSSLLGTSKIEKTYLAAVNKAPDSKEGVLNHYLFHDSKLRKSFVTNKKNKQAKLASLFYKTIDQSEHYSLLEIKLSSGRFHQIRSQLSAIGSPIKGDVKYGARRSNKDRSINLHSSKLTFPFQHTEESISVNASVPNEPLWSAFAVNNPLILQNNYEIWKNKT